MKSEPEVRARLERVELTAKIPRLVREIDLDKMLFFQGVRIDPNPDAVMLNICNMPLKHYLKQFRGKEVVLIIEEKVGGEG